jgi:glutamate/tyrosine decarboxylase-like PLP-dependent enzyme
MSTKKKTNATKKTDISRGISPLGCWTSEQLQRFLEIRQEFFLDPTGTNRERFFDATTVLQRALFAWYLDGGQWSGMLKLVSEFTGKWAELRKEERRTLSLRRFALNNATPDVPAVESSVSEHQWQKIFGSLGVGLAEPGLFDRFLVQLDEETNPSLRFNHRYMGELLPHDNMISYLSSITATFLNENAIIGKVSPCVTHMEQAAVKWLLTLVGWDGDLRAEQSATRHPIQRLPTMPPPSRRFSRWEREEPTGTIVAGGTIANISAMLIARSAVFDYLLGWPGAVQTLGPLVAWDLVKKIWGKERLIVLTSKGAHYSVRKAALQAGASPSNVIEVAGSENPWVLDGVGLERQMTKLVVSDLVLAVVSIAGKTETGYVDRLDQIAAVLNDPAKIGEAGLPTFPEVLAHLCGKVKDGYPARLIRNAVKRFADPAAAKKQFKAARLYWHYGKNSETKKLLDRIDGGRNEMESARHNRLFLHVDAAHGGGFLTVPELRNSVFAGIELADTITIDGHKSLYCYYPCGGLLVRASRWAQTFSTGHSAYISEDDNRGAYREGLMFGRFRADEKKTPFSVGDKFNVDEAPRYDDTPETALKEVHLSRLDAVLHLTRRPMPAERSELTHNPFNEYLEGSRGAQGIMQLYFNLSTLGLRGYRSLLGWMTLLRSRTEEAVSLGMSDLRLITDLALPEDLAASDKIAAIESAGHSSLKFEDLRKSQRTVLPATGGRFLRLSGGDCNQLLITYIPSREAKLIATASASHWKEHGVKEGIQRVMRYIWRVNEHLWGEHIYANPHFSYYLGHTSFDLALPSMESRSDAGKKLAALLTKWNAWTRQTNDNNPFFDVLCHYFVNSLNRDDKLHHEPDDTYIEPYARKFFCHKIVVMHPYTDESLLGDMLRRLAFWGERSVNDVRISDMTANFLFPDIPKDTSKKQTTAPKLRASRKLRR